MSAFDIIWLLVCIGLPIVSGILSTTKKQKAKTKAGEPVGKRDFLEDLIKEVTKEIKEYNTSGDKDIDKEEEASGRTPASGGGASPAASSSSRKAAVFVETRHPGRYNNMETRRGTAAAPATKPATYSRMTPAASPAMAGDLTAEAAEAAKTARATYTAKYAGTTGSANATNAAKYASATRTAKTAQSADPTAAKQIRPASSYHKHLTLEHQHITPEHLRGESGSTATEPAPQMADSRAGVERIDPRRMIIYDAVLNPKFRE